MYGHDELWKQCILRENIFILKFSERSSYNSTVNQSKIRCIKNKHHMQLKYVTWYGHDHLVPLISLSKASSWSPSSPAWHHDLHHLDLYQCVITWSSRQLLFLQLLLSHSDKVKQLFGACILCNKETTISVGDITICKPPPMGRLTRRQVILWSPEAHDRKMAVQ